MRWGVFFILFNRDVGSQAGVLTGQVMLVDGCVYDVGGANAV
jgi:hypothetical protein